MKNAKIKIMTPNSDRPRMVTGAGWKYLKDKKGYYRVDSEEPKSDKKKDAPHVQGEEEGIKDVKLGFESIGTDNSDIDEVEDLRTKYVSLSGKQPDKRWKEKRLKDEIKELTQP